MSDKITIDFETRSKANLLAVGTWNYSKHDSTEVMCLNWKFRDESGHWHMRHGYMIDQLAKRISKAKRMRDQDKAAELIARYKQDIKDLDETPLPTRLFELISQGHQVEAHNAFFERCIWQHICVERMGWPAIDFDQWRCSAAKASMHALPRDLERATGEMCPDQQKDMEGRRVMLKLSKPANPTKAEPDREWNEEPEDLRILWDYCRQDVDSEHALSEALEDLPPHELAMWQMDQRMNLRGMYADLDLARHNIAIAETVVNELNGELAMLTHGEIEKPSQRQKIKKWINGQVAKHHQVDGTGADKLDRLMMTGDYDDTPVGAVVNILSGAARTSTKKYQAMIDRADADDWRIRDMMMYHGANTGRWSGKGVQPHNFPRGFIKDMERTCNLFLDSDLIELLMFYSRREIMEQLSWMLRGALCAPPGRQLYVADYSAIEARVVMWLANELHALEVFASGKDIYKDMATSIYGIPYEDVGGEERRMGKQAILGLGYQMGAPKFWDTVAGYEPHYKNMDRGMFKELPSNLEKGFLAKPGTQILDWLKKTAANNEELSKKLKFGQTIDDKGKRHLLAAAMSKDLEWGLNVWHFLFFRDVVNTYRTKYAGVKAMWYGLEDIAIAAFKCPGERVEGYRVAWEYDAKREFMTCELPSKRKLYYRRPQLGINKFKKESLYYWSIDSVTNQWRLTGTYGGKLVENITQAVARDLMAEAMLRIDKGSEYDLLASVHDELICEADQGVGDVKEFENLMSELPAWAEGCPVNAEGWRGMRYRK